MGFLENICCNDNTIAPIIWSALIIYFFHLIVWQMLIVQLSSFDSHHWKGPSWSVLMAQWLYYIILYYILYAWFLLNIKRKSSSRNLNWNKLVFSISMMSSLSVKSTVSKGPVFSAKITNSSINHCQLPRLYQIDRMIDQLSV